MVAQPGSQSSGSAPTEKTPLPGVRPSPLDGRLTTSTGTRSLDSLLAGHAGLVMGCSLLIEESGTTDFGGSLLRYFAAEGVLQGHSVHLLGVGDTWGRELPGLSAEGHSALKAESQPSSDEKMKIAWRYERLGEFGVGPRDRILPSSTRGAISQTQTQTQTVFCHDFDLSKRLILPESAKIHFIPTQTRPSVEFTDPDLSVSPFARFLNHLSTQLSASATAIHRIIIPSLLSPALYPANASQPGALLQFLHALRALLRKYPSQLTAIITIPLSLYPRSTGLTRWMELLSDGVLELAPFQSTAVVMKATPAAAIKQEEPPQGVLKIHRLPVFHEKGGGGGEASEFGDDLAFTLSRRKGLVIKPFSLPPVEGDFEAQQGGLETDHGRATKVDIEF